MSLPNGQKVIAFDFDGVLHDYHGYKGPGPENLDGPIPGMLDVVNYLIGKNVHVVIHTTRAEFEVKPWLEQHGFPDLDVYNDKWKRIDVFVDDRAVRFDPKWLTMLGPTVWADGLILLRPHWKTTGTSD